MKTFYCKICKKMNKSFTGVRFMVREHLRENHGIKSNRLRTEDKEHYKSPITAEMGVL
jgi:hypothetical protein